MLARGEDPRNYDPGATARAAPLPRLSNPLLDAYQYSGEALRAVALPFGPLGGGSVALAGDGGLRQWQVVNRVCHDAHVPDSFFAVKARSHAAAATAATACVLQSSALYDAKGFTPAPIVTDADVPPASVALLQPTGPLPGVDAVGTLTAKYPTATVEYTTTKALGAANNVCVAMECACPCVPLDEKSSSLPCLFFTFTVANGSATDAVDVTLMMSQQNFVGWDGASQITDQVCNAGFGGNANCVTANVFENIIGAHYSSRRE